MELFLISEISDKDSEDCENDEVSNERPSTKLFVVFVVAWSSIAIIFSLIWWFKYRQKATALHRIFYMLPLIKLFYLVITMFYWEMKSVSDRVPLWVTVFYLISLQTSELFLFGFFLLISKGWHITRLNLTSAEKKSILVISVSLNVTILCSKLFRGYYSFAAMLMYIVILKFTFSNVNFNMEQLYIQQNLLRQTLHTV